MKVDVYTHGHEPAVVDSHRQRTAANSAAYLTPLLHAGMSLLDVGCETGTITKDFAALVASGRVVGVDVDQAMLDEAAIQFGEVPGLQFIYGNVYELPFEDASFDVVHAHQVLQHLSDQVAALREMARVVKPGGIVAVRDVNYASMAWYPPTPELTSWLALYRGVAHANGAEPDAGPKLLAWAHQAGLTDVRASASVVLHVGDDAAQWGQSWAARCETSSFHGQAIEQGRATAADLDGIAAGWRRWGADPDAWFAALHGEIIARASAD